MTLQYIEDILKTLPVGYYLGNRAEVVFEKAGLSYCNPMDGTIHISGQNVLDALSHMVTPKPESTEEYTRTILYHEIAHLILTPKYKKFPPWLNIFEDERIETLLRNYFLGTNFKQFVFDCNGWTPEKKPTSAEEFFYFIVRFRQGPEMFLEKVKKLIHRWNNVNSTTDPTGSTGSEYKSDVERFWQEVRNYWNDEEKDDKSSDNNESNDGSSSENDQSSEDQTGSQGGASSDDEKENEGKSPSRSSEPDKGDSENCTSGASEKSSSENEPSSSDGEGGEGEDGEDALREAIREAVESAMQRQDSSKVDIDKERVAVITKKLLDEFFDANITSEAHRILIKNSKKRAQRSPCSNGYTGKINAKSVVTRNDYRWLVRKGGDSDNRFNRTHITLWVDTSGSFCYDIDNVNKLIYSLAQLEKKMPNEFAFDLVSMAYKNQIVDKKHRLEASGGNAFGPGIAEIARKLRRSGWDHYDVMVFDGDMFTDDYGNRGSLIERHRAAFNAIDTSKTVVVTDTANKTYFDHGCKKARVEYIRDNYASEFIKVVLQLLERAMA